MAAERIIRPMLVLAVALTLWACGPGSLQPPQQFPVTVEAYASPTCPVQVEPPDPQCVPRPVEGATIRVVATPGQIVETLVTDQSGLATTSLPAGRYTFDPRPVEGLPGTPEPEVIEVADDLPGLGVVFRYDTGIRGPES